MTLPVTVPVPLSTCSVPSLVMFWASVEPVMSSVPPDALVKVVVINVPVAVKVPALLKVTPAPKMALPEAGIFTVPPVRLLNAAARPGPCVKTALFIVHVLVL